MKEKQCAMIRSGRRRMMWITGKLSEDVSNLVKLRSEIVIAYFMNNNWMEEGRGYGGGVFVIR